MNIAILLAGGAGTRVNTQMPKQYIRAGGHMMVTYALRPIICSKHIDYVHIVAESEWRELIIADAYSAGLDVHKIRDFAAPGTDRQTSILNAIQNIITHMGGIEAVDRSGNPDTVLIHDAARPFLDVKLVDKCFKALKGHGGVMPVLPVKDTVYRSINGRGIAELLNRRELFAGQAPELFCLKPYYRANMRLMPDGISKIKGSSEPAFMAGMDIVMIEGQESNFKVTSDEDMNRFRRIMENNE